MESHDPQRVAALEEFWITAAFNVATLGGAQVSARLSLISKACSELAEGHEQIFSGVMLIFFVNIKGRNT